MASENRGSQIIGATATFLVLTWVTVPLRIYARSRITKSIGVDDFLIAACLISFTLSCVFILTAVYYGEGRHFVNLAPENAAQALKFWFFTALAYDVSSGLAKISIAISLVRIAVKRWMLAILYTIVVVVALYNTFYFFLLLFQCHPVNFFWMQDVGEKGTCVDVNVILYAMYGYSAINTLSDWILAILPIFLVWNLNMNPRTKFLLAIVLGLGALASTATIVRIFYLEALATTQDFLWDSTPVAVWSIVEPGIAIAASSIAFLKSLIRVLIPRGNSSEGSTKRNVGGAARSMEKCELTSLGTGKGMTAVEAHVKMEEGWVSRHWGRGGSSTEELVDIAEGSHIKKTVEVRMESISISSLHD